MTSTGFADQPAGHVVFVLAVGDFEPRDHEQRGMHAAHHRDRARLAALVIAALDQVAVLALGAHHGRDVRAVRLHAIGAVVDPAGVGIAHDHHVAGADVVAAVVLVPARRRDLGDVDVLAGVDVLQERPGLDHRRAGCCAPPSCSVRQYDTSSTAEPSAGRPSVRLMRRTEVRMFARMRWPCAIARNVVEQHRRVAHLAHVEIDDAADLLLALGARDLLHLAGGPQRLDPGAQVLLGLGDRVDGRRCLLRWSAWRLRMSAMVIGRLLARSRTD